MKTGIRKTLDGYQAWFKIGNQTFHLEDHSDPELSDKENKETARFFENMLKKAFKL